MPERDTKTCDYGHEENQVERLDTGGNSGVFLCSKHWEVEMKWRGLRNEELEPQNQFDILPFPQTPTKSSAEIPDYSYIRRAEEEALAEEARLADLEANDYPPGTNAGDPGLP